MPETKEHAEAVEEALPGVPVSTSTTGQLTKRSLSGRKEKCQEGKEAKFSSANRGKTRGGTCLAKLGRGSVISWQPERSDHRFGKPKRAAWANACRAILSAPVPGDRQGRTFAEAIAETLAWKAMRGDLRAAQELADRAEGRSRQGVAVDRSALRQAFDRMTDEEMLAYATSGQLPAWFPELEGGEGWK